MSLNLMTDRCYALIGAAGFVAPLHMRAIKEVGGTLVAAFDLADSVGVIDSYFPQADFFVEFERFDRHIDKLRRCGRAVDYISICSPNHLHDSHVRFALRSGADAVCEKPLVLNPWNIDGLAELEQCTGRKVNTILQLRLHPSVIALRDKINRNGRCVHDVDLTYVTSRGHWYYTSWKGDEHKSGGVATNIGIHLFDLLSFVFGPLQENYVHHRAIDCAAGFIIYEKARVRWFLSVNRNDLPANISPGKTTFRSIIVDDEEVELSDGFTDLHTMSYREILAGNGFSLDDVRPAVEAAAYIRSADLEPGKGKQHPFLSYVFDPMRYRDGFPV